MRTDFAAYQALLESWAHRRPTADGRAAARRRRDVSTGRPQVVLDRAPGGRTVLDTLRDRHSSLAYDASRCVDTRSVLSLAQEALRRDADNWSDGIGPDEVFVIALRPRDVETGIYRVTAQFVSRIADLPGDLDGFGLQREFARAGGIVSAAVDLDRADSWRGGHGYRIAMLRSAAVVYDVHLRTQSLGLVGTVFAGFIPGAVRRSLSSDGVGRQQMFAATYAATLVETAARNQRTRFSTR